MRPMLPKLTYVFISEVAKGINNLAPAGTHHCFFNFVTHPMQLAHVIRSVKHFTIMKRAFSWKEADIYIYTYYEAIFMNVYYSGNLSNNKLGNE